MRVGICGDMIPNRKASAGGASHGSFHGEPGGAGGGSPGRLLGEYIDRILGTPCELFIFSHS